ncbi:MAG: phenylphosphate carboxylase subunit gamma [Syntrophorhabdaceae bacterium]|nr:phenylphosphate carboxylase subunit gamma [Syntrophorhabdaceae bacterium]
MAVYDTFISKDFKDLAEDEEIIGVIRDLTPGKSKYRGKYAKFVVSKDENKYPERLWIRLGRGQLIEKPCSMKILEEINIFPEGL